MRSPVLAVLAGGLALGCFLAGRWSAPHPVAGTGSKRILYYYDPMHPAYKSDKPGIAPDCGMELEPFYEGGGPAVPKRPGAVQIAVEKQQLAGVKVAAAERIAATHTLRLPGRIAVDETRISRVVSGTEGQIREVHSASVGSVVKKDDLLATFYAREFLSAQQAYFYALNNLKSAAQLSPEQERANRIQLRQVEETLVSLGMTEYQIRQIAEKREAAKLIDVRAPATSIILARNTAVGQRFDRNTELYRLADLNHVWVFADVFEREARFIRPGQGAAVVYEGRKIQVRMSDVLPQFDPATRSMKVRFEADNANLQLRPDMYVDVEIPVALPAAVTVPVDAVVDSGLKKIVYVEGGEGSFEPRQVETQWQVGDRVGIAKGLREGERIVVAGTFLVDSETRLQTGGDGAAQAPRMVKDPVCGMETDSAKAKKVDYGGKTYLFCSDRCKKEFEKNPAKYVGGDAGAKDPVCGMETDPAKAPKAEYGGKTYHFCSDHCKKEFEKNPEKYTGKKAAA